MPRIDKELIIRNPQGLHARPAAMFVQIASKYNAHVNIRKGNERVNGKSIIGLLTLGMQFNTKIVVEVDGEDALEMVMELEKLLLSEDIR